MPDLPQPERLHYRDVIHALLADVAYTDPDPEYKLRVEREAASVPTLELIQTGYQQLHTIAARIAGGDITMLHSPFSGTVADQRREALRHLDALRTAATAAEVLIEQLDQRFRRFAEHTAAEKLTR